MRGHGLGIYRIKGKWRKKKHGTRRGVVFFAKNISAQVLTVGGNDLLVPVKTLFLIAVPGVRGHGLGIYRIKGKRV